MRRAAVWFVFGSLLLLGVRDLGARESRYLRKRREKAERAPLPKGFERLVLAQGELERVAYLFTPSDHDPKRKVPLVLVFHGGHGSGRVVMKYVKFVPVAEKEGFLVVYPNAYASHWNDGRATTASGPDDVKFVGALIDRIAAIRGVDPDRVYAVGTSNGGFMTTRLACELSGRIAAGGVIVASMGEPLFERCSPERPMSMLFMNGTKDRAVPWKGGVVKKNRSGGKGGRVVSTPQAVELWARINGCEGKPERRRLADLDRKDRSTAEKVTYRGCREGREVVLYEIVGGGHTVPGAAPRSKRLARWLFGATNMDIDAVETIWSFLKRQKR